jgi:hypothetical protein
MGIHVKYPFFLYNLHETLRFLHILEQFSNVIHQENLYNGRRVVAFGETDRWTGGYTDKAKIIVTFGNFSNTFKNVQKPIKKVLLFS